MIYTAIDTFYLAEEQLINSPSRKDEIDEVTETSLRIYGCDLIQESGILLRLPQAVMATGQVLFHRFYCKKSFARFNVKRVSASCVWLASKLEESPRKARQVLVVFHRMECRRENLPIEHLDTSSKKYIDLKADLIRTERHLLKEMGFICHVEHPHKFISNYLATLETPAELRQEAWNLANDSLRTTLCVRFKSEVVACGVVYAAARRFQVPLPENPPWWKAFDAEKAGIDEVCRVLAHLYSLPKAQYIPVCKEGGSFATSNRSRDSPSLPVSKEGLLDVPPVNGDTEEAAKDAATIELLHPGQKALLLPGGRGGRGNASFKTGLNRVPKIAENGEEGPEMWLDLELKLVADVGIVGAPNAGKSTFLSVISAAQPAIANYPFTTLLPNLGVVSFDYDATVVVADLPGLLEGAHRGFGLGHEFLRHSERCSVLVHVVDGSSPQPEYEYEAVRLELEMFSPELAEKPYLVVYNKMDLPDAYENWKAFRDSLRSRGIEPFCMSAVKREGTRDVICAAYELVHRREAAKEVRRDSVNLNYVADMVKKQRNAPINEFEISHDSSSKTWYVQGLGLQRFVQMTNWRYMDSDRRFQHVLEACGVNKSLLKLGVKEGDTVVVGDMELVWHDYDKAGSTSRRKWAAEPSQ